MVRMKHALSVDTETTGLRLYQGDHITVASFADDNDAWVTRPEEAGKVLQQAVDEGRLIIMHNSIFDRAVFETKFGIQISDDQIYDTMAVDWMLDENADHRLKEGLATRIFGLNAQVEKKELKALMRGRTQADIYKELRAIQEYLGIHRGNDRYLNAAQTRVIAKKMADETTKTWADMTYDDLHDYALKDADLTYKLYEHQKNEAWPADPYVHPYFEQMQKVLGMTYRINRTGICVNEDKAVEGLEAAQSRIKEIEPTFGSVNMNSPKQVACLLYDDWKLPEQGETLSGNRVTDKDALNNLSYDPRVAELLEYRQLAKQVDAYYLPLLDSIGHDGRIHPELHPCRTVTGRWSCSRPNLQTIPRESTSTAIREVFTAEKGLVLTELDLSQIEVRVAADLSQEPALLSVYEEGGDVYQALADEIGVTRDVAKTVILSAQYGVGARKLSRTLARGTGKPPNVAQAKSILARYWANYPYLKRLMDGLTDRAQRRGYIPLWKPGRRRLYRSPSSPYPRHYSALNAMIQGGAAEFMKDVMLELEPQLDAGRIVLTVHDSVVIEHEPGYDGEIMRRITEITKDVSPYKIATPWEAKQWS